MYSYAHMAGQKQDDQLEHTFSRYMRIRDVALKTYQRRWTIRSGERGSGISAPAARHDDEDEDLHPQIFKWWTILEFSNGQLKIAWMLLAHFKSRAVTVPLWVFKRLGVFFSPICFFSGPSLLVCERYVGLSVRSLFFHRPLFVGLTIGE